MDKLINDFGTFEKGVGMQGLRVAGSLPVAQAGPGADQAILGVESTGIQCSKTNCSRLWRRTSETDGTLLGGGC